MQSRRLGKNIQDDAQQKTRYKQCNASYAERQPDKEQKIQIRGNKPM